MPRHEEIAKKRSAPSKILRMAFPDEETLAFWKATGDDPQEYATRIARFSRALGKDATKKAFRSPERRRRDAVPAVQSRRSKPLGRLLTMPSHPDVGARSSAREFERNTRSRQGGNVKTSGMRKAPGVRAKKRGTQLARGKATQVMTYPRLRTKRALVEASRDAGLALSSFMIMASLNAAAALQGCKVADLIPQTELRQYLRKK